MDNESYLTEDTLGIFLNRYLVDGEWIHDKKFINRYRPDFRNDKLKLIVEFDGYPHYTSSKRILSDINKDKLEIEAGYDVIRIPYFIQLSTTTIFNLFKLNIKYVQSYPHGFIDSKCVLPSDFCELGIEKFKQDLIRFNYLQNDILTSLNNKIEANDNDVRYVLPSSLSYLTMKDQK